MYHHRPGPSKENLKAAVTFMRNMVYRFLHIGTYLRDARTLPQTHKSYGDLPKCKADTKVAVRYLGSVALL